jgi:small-conductance mechanosensitive channel
LQNEHAGQPSLGARRWFAKASGNRPGSKVAGPLRTVEGQPMHPVVTSFDPANIVPLLLGTVALLLFALIAILALNRLLQGWLRRVEARVNLSYETVLTLTRVVSGGLWLVTALLVLNLWGVSVAGLWTLLASVIAVIGVGFLAVWTMVSNVTASFFISLWRPFRLGQTVEILPETLKGRVIDRNLMFTIMRDDGGNLLHVPNNLFFQKMFRVSDRGKPTPFECLETERTDTSSKSAPPP